MERYTGDDWEFTSTLKIEDSAQDVTGATIKAAVVTQTSNELIAAVTLIEDANWANGIVTIDFPASVTGISYQGTAYIELQVDLGGKKKTYGRQPFTIIKGVIA